MFDDTASGKSIRNYKVFIALRTFDLMMVVFFFKKGKYFEQM